MILDDLAAMRAIDTQDLLHDVEAWPEEVAQAWQVAASLSIPGDLRDVQHVVMAGMGGSAMAGALAQVYAADHRRVPIVGLSTEDLPAWVGAQTLIIANSHSGNTDETLAVSRAALARDARLVGIVGALGGGGQLAAL